MLQSELPLEQPELVQQIRFDRVHRIGSRKRNSNQPRPIVAKFERFQDRETIRKAGMELNSNPRSKYKVREQFPKEIEDRRKLLYSAMYRLKLNPQNRVNMVRDKLYLNGKVYIPEEDSEYRLPPPRTTYRRSDSNSGPNTRFMQSVPNRNTQYVNHSSQGLTERHGISFGSGYNTPNRNYSAPPPPPPPHQRSDFFGTPASQGLSGRQELSLGSGYNTPSRNYSAPPPPQPPPQHQRSDQTHSHQGFSERQELSLGSGYNTSRNYSAPPPPPPPHQRSDPISTYNRFTMLANLASTADNNTNSMDERLPGQKHKTLSPLSEEGSPKKQKDVITPGTIVLDGPEVSNNTSRKEVDAECTEHPDPAPNPVPNHINDSNIPDSEPMDLITHDSDIRCDKTFSDTQGDQSSSHATEIPGGDPVSQSGEGNDG